jgi:hypothetical protein
MGRQKKEVEATVSDQSNDLAGETLADQPSDTGLVHKAYIAFVGYLEEDFPAWDDLPESTQQQYADAAQYVVDGHEPRTEFEKSVRLILVAAEADA